MKINAVCSAPEVSKGINSLVNFLKLEQLNLSMGVRASYHSCLNDVFKVRFSL